MNENICECVCCFFSSSSSSVYFCSSFSSIYCCGSLHIHKIDTDRLIGLWLRGEQILILIHRMVLRLRRHSEDAMPVAVLGQSSNYIRNSSDIPIFIDVCLRGIVIQAVLSCSPMTNR